jgi:hypothetical protein
MLAAVVFFQVGANHMLHSLVHQGQPCKSSQKAFTESCPYVVIAQVSIVTAPQPEDILLPDAPDYLPVTSIDEKSEGVHVVEKAGRSPPGQS